MYPDEVLGAELDGGIDGVAANLPGDQLVERGAGQEVLGLGALGRMPSATWRVLTAVGALQRPVHVGHHRQDDRGTSRAA
jgi:hypothetical protein